MLPSPQPFFYRDRRFPCDDYLLYVVYHHNRCYIKHDLVHFLCRQHTATTGAAATTIEAGTSTVDTHPAAAADTW